MVDSVVPDNLIIGSFQSNVTNVDRVGVRVRKPKGQMGRQVLIKEKFHPGGILVSFRARSAANTRQARISSLVGSGKSLRISASVIPEARYSRISYTVIRNPRMQGLPPLLPGSIEILSL